MDTITQLPDHADGTAWYVCPRDGIPPHNVETHELSYVAMKPEVDRIMNEHFSDLETGSSEAGPRNVVVDVPYNGSINAIEAPNASSEDPNAALNGGLLRVLTIGSMCMMSFKALLHEDLVSQRPADVAMADLIKDGLVPGAKVRKATLDASHSQSGVLSLGSAHTEAILHGTGDAGLTYLQAVVNSDDPYDFIPIDRKTVLSRILARSPVNTHVLDLCMRNAKDKKRMLVMVTTPWEQL
ncbi:hypothetical protein KVR01_010536 [Diaporthe batatas]|uniref:uncharacterized protein n=1 Tax=Diaporthe batatas TaxID=748121 RepID=UPI001D041FD3|nr:uncharacterized protein KVR01_010536 [Diaporthe batatas]KAG8159899.1 hypothetical protein KVR01_010536 [Diaporthe batatas]